jgi:hypothetical protein
MTLRSRLLAIGLCFTGQVIEAPEKEIVDGVTYHVLRAPAGSVNINHSGGCIPVSSYLPQSGVDGFELTPNARIGNTHSLGNGVFDFKRKR